MKPISFSEANKVLAKDQPKYQSLPAHVDTNTFVVTSCWKLTWKDRLKLIFTSRVWAQQLTFGNKLQPQKLSIDKPDMI